MSIRVLRRLTPWLMGVAGLLGAGAASAVTVPVLVVEADSGKVIYGQAATDPWYPASITKLMTTYVALDMVRQGRFSMDGLVTVSAAAAAEPPSKMGFRPGTQLTLDNALKIIMVKSANDVAYAIGETLGGSAEGFSDIMNETARRIGMRESRWYNANGLPDPRQWTSARDMAVLGRALMRDFPDHQDLFSISAIQFGRHVMANHNGLIGRYPGADGMKTGFICSGGFNVVSSATRNGRRLIAVVMGQPSARARDLKAADLFDLGFGQSTGWTNQTLDALPPSSVSAPPDMRPYICDRRKPMPGEDSSVNAGARGADAAAQLMGGATPAGTALAFAAVTGASMHARSLPPRGPLQPIPVYIGRTSAEGQAMLAEQEAAEKAAAAEARAAKVAAAKAKREAAQAARQAKLAEAKAARDARAAAKPAPRVAAKPAPAAAGKPAAKVATKPAAKPDAKPTKPEAKGAKATPKPVAKVTAKPDAKPTKVAAKVAAKPAKPAGRKPRGDDE